MNPKIVYLVVICITVLSMAAGATGAWLTAKGYQGGELLIGTCGTGLGGLIAMLSSTRTSATGTPADPVQTTVVNPPSNPVNTTDTH